MSLDRTDVIREARSLFENADKVSSLDLPIGSNVGDKAIPWRLNGHAPAHPLHQMASRVGGFPPQLARYFIRRFSKVGDLICDPFCGKGTSLLEAVAGSRRALGCDIGPDAVIVSRAKTNWPRIEDICEYVEKLPRRGVRQNVHRDVKLFFHRKTLEQIISAREKILVDMSRGRGQRRQLAEFTMGVLLGILHGRSHISLSLPCNHAFAMSPNYVRKYVKEHNLKCPEQDVQKCLMERILKILPGPKASGIAHVFESPAQKMWFNRKGGWSGKVDLIVTSPPYLARQTYIKDAWLRLWLLGRDAKAVRSKTLETGNILRFVDTMESCLGECLRLLKPEGRCFLVCGTASSEISGKKIKVRTAGLVMYAATKVRHKKYRWYIENYIEDKLVLKRGSYFAVRSNGDIDNGRRRISEDDVVSLVKVRK